MLQGGKGPGRLWARHMAGNMLFCVAGGHSQGADDTEARGAHAGMGAVEVSGRGVM